MSEYQVLARKYRPKNFDELIGQTHISNALTNAIDTGRLHHAYLFTGTRGVGKTTIARILAKCLNCETGITSQPCGKCDTCKSIDKGRFIDLIEIDAASRTKVEDTRELLENVPYAPTQGRFKVYLIDEVHMLSTHSFNALLKTLEEPPTHAKFILATTDPQKLPITIVSRCLQFVLRPMSQELLHDHLIKILNNEQVAFENNALWQLASSAKGSVRDALSLTDQAIAFGGGRIGDETVRQMLGLIDGADTLQLLYDIYKDERKSVAKSIHRLRSQLSDASHILETLIEFVHQMAMVQLLPELPLDMNDNDKQKLIQLSNIIPADVLQLYYEILIKSKDGLKFANTPMQGLEMAILRLLAFRPLANNEISNNQLKENDLQKNALSIENHQADVSTNVLKSQHLPNNESLNDENLVDDKLDDLKNNPIIDNNLQNKDKNLLIDGELEKDELMDNDINQTLNQEIANQEIIDNNVPVEQPIVETAPIQKAIIDNAMLEAVYPENAYQENSHQTNDDKETLDQEVLKQEMVKQQTIVQTQLAKPLQDELLENELIENDPNRNALIESELIESELIENISHHNRPAQNPIEKPIHITPNQTLLTNDLQSQLKPQEIALTGEWTPQKWDYWSHCAYENGELSADEFALAKESTITGQINGQATLMVHNIHYQIEVSFHSLKEKLSQAFGANLALQSGEVVYALTPQGRHNDRHAQVVYQAEQNLLNSPVMATLAQGGFLNKAPLGQVRLQFAR